MTYKARVRGIYSSALTKLLLSNGFEIVQPSQAIVERFGLKDNAESPDVDIYDRHNRQGVNAVGNTGSLAVFKTVLLKNLTDVIFREQHFPIDGIYKGIVKKGKGEFRFVSVDLGSLIGRLFKDMAEVAEGSTVVVQVQRRHASAGEPWLSTRINIPSEYAVLTQDEKIRVSLKIRDMQKRMSLIDLGKRVTPHGWGIIWRTTAAVQPEEVLENEVVRLRETQKEVFRRMEEMKAPALLWGSQYYMNVEFPFLSKVEFDNVRAQVTPTIAGHHRYKASGQTISASLDVAENILEGGVQTDEAEHLFRETVEAEYPYEGFFIGIEHVKPNGKVYYLGRAKVEKRSGDVLVYSRVFKHEGFYDGLGTAKEPDDRAVTEARIGGWHYTTRYFSKDGIYKGAHINLHTPLELYPNHVRYVDLEVDVCLFPDGEVKVVDEEYLEEAVAKGFISQKLAAIVRSELSKVLNSLKEKPTSNSQPD